MDMHTIRLGHTDYAYYELPQPGKPKLLLLHGMMVESHCFEALAARLHADYHLVLLDLKGHGRTAHGSSYDADYTNAVIAAELDEFCARVIGEPCFVAGYSLGGQQAIKLAGSAPERIKGLVLIDSAPDLSLFGAMMILLLLAVTPAVFRSAGHVRRFFGQKSSPEFGEYMLAHCVEADAQGHYRLIYDRRHSAPATLGKARQRANDLWAAAQATRVPVLILRAAKSAVISDGMEARMRKSFAQCTVKRLEGIGHDLVFKNPDVVAAEMRAFLKGCAV